MEWTQADFQTMVNTTESESLLDDLLETSTRIMQRELAQIHAEVHAYRESLFRQCGLKHGLIVDNGIGIKEGHTMMLSDVRRAIDIKMTWAKDRIRMVLLKNDERIVGILEFVQPKRKKSWFHRKV